MGELNTSEFPKPSSIGALHSKAHRAMKDGMGSITEEYGLSLTEWLLVAFTAENKRIKQVDIAKFLHVEDPMITRIVRSLVKKGFLLSKKDDIDKRANILVPTSQALNLIPEIELRLGLKMRSMLRGSSLEEIATYMKVINIALQNYEIDSSIIKED